MYNTNTVTLQEAKLIAIAYLEAGIIPLLVSAPGIGKTTMVAEIAEELGYELRHLRLNSMPPEEAVGLQYLDHNTKRTIRYAPSWLPEEDGSEGKVLVFIDELMQAPDEYRKGIMSALLEKYLGQHKIPDNCMFISAGNSVEDGSNVHELDRATADRFGVIKIRPDLESWANDYAAKKNLSPAIVGYLRFRPDHFELTDNDGIENMDVVIKPSPRSWEALCSFLDVAKQNNLDESIIKAGINGKVGESIGASVWTLIGTLSKLPDLKQLLKMSSKDQNKHSPDRMDVLWAYGQAMIWYCDTSEKTLQVFNLLSNFQQKSGIPFVETRTNIVETILKRARGMHGFSVTERPEILEILVAWDHEKKAAQMFQEKPAAQNEEMIQMQEAA